MPVTCPELFIPEPNAFAQPGAKGSKVVPAAALQMNGRLVSSLLAYTAPVTWPESLIPRALEEVHPVGSGMSVMPEAFPRNACVAPPLSTKPAICPALFMAKLVVLVQPGSEGNTVTPEGEAINERSIMEASVPYPVTCPELLIPDNSTPVNPLGDGSTTTEYPAPPNTATEAQHNSPTNFRIRESSYHIRDVLNGQTRRLTPGRSPRLNQVPVP